MYRYLMGFLLLMNMVGHVCAQSKSLVFVIGNAEYRKEAESLRNIKNDVRTIGRTLKSLGVDLFEDQVHFDLAENDFRQKLEDFGEALKQYDVGIFYYAGHGMQVHGVNYLIPVDERISKEEDVKNQAIKITEVLEVMNHGGSKANLLVIDACRKNPFKFKSKAKFGSKIEPKAQPKGLISMSSALVSRRGTMLLFATKPNDVVEEDGGGDSAFVTALVESMNMGGIRIQDVVEKTIIRTEALTDGRQQPLAEGVISGDFYLNRMKETHPIDIGIDLVMIRGGIFKMGSNDGADWEKPVHNVNITDFYMSKTQVTVRQYRECVNAGVCSLPHWDDGSCYLWNGKEWAKGVLGLEFRNDNQPVVCVDWEQARGFAKWLGSDLPSEAQWEYASRSGGKDIKYPWGNHDPTCEIANFQYNCHKQTTDVCSKTGGNTKQGLCDMGGNVWQWLLDEWHNSYRDAPSDDKAWCSDKECNSHTSVSRVNRGGSWLTNTFGLRSVARSYNSPNNRYDYLGFRIVKSVH
jgi:formylglycine-generating enzyme required for sulfatase activity